MLRGHRKDTSLGYAPVFQHQASAELQQHLYALAYLLFAVAFA